MTTVAIDQVGGTTARATLTGLPNPFDYAQVQFSSTRDFQFAVNTVVRFDNQQTQRAIAGLNQAATYFARARAWTGTLVEAWGPITGFRTSAVLDRDLSPASVMIQPAMVVIPEAVLAIDGGAAAGYPLTNLLVDAPVAYRYAFANGGPMFNGSILIDVGGAVVDTLALLNTNLPEDAIVNIYPRASFAFQQGGQALIQQNSPFRASAALPGRRGYHGIWSLAAPAAYRFLQIDWQSSQQFVTMEHLVVGRNRMTKNFATEKTEESASLTTVERKRSGIPDRVRGLPIRHVEFEIQNLTEAQYESIYFDLVYRENEPALVVPNGKKGPFLHDRILYGDLGTSRTTNTTSPFFTRGFAINSII